MARPKKVIKVKREKDDTPKHVQKEFKKIAKIVREDVRRRGLDFRGD